MRSEYFLDDRNGPFVDPTDSTLSTLWNGQRRGGYLEGVYRLNRTWDVGYRFDKLWADASGPFASAFNPYRNSAELTWRNSEFSLLRLQDCYIGISCSDLGDSACDGGLGLLQGRGRIILHGLGCDRRLRQPCDPVVLGLRVAQACIG